MITVMTFTALWYYFTMMEERAGNRKFEANAGYNFFIVRQLYSENHAMIFQMLLLWFDLLL